MRPAPGQTYDLAFHADEPRDPATGRWEKAGAREAFHKSFGPVIHETQHGDYRIEVRGPSDPEDAGYLSMAAYDRSGNHVADNYVGPWQTDESSPYIEHVPEVAPNHRRKGLATAFYNLGEKLLGKPSKAAPTHTADAEAFWQARRAANRAMVDLSTVDLARPAADWQRAPAQTSPYGQRRVEKHTISPKVDNDTTVRSIAKALQVSRRYRSLSVDRSAEVKAVTRFLYPYGIKSAAVRMALSLTRTDSGYVGTAHSPNARLAGHAARLEGGVRDVRDSEVYYRAAYVANAADRLQRSLNAGATQQEALRREKVYYLQHEKARRGRLDSAAQVQTAGNLFGQKDGRGTLVGWYLNPLLNNEVECRTANGHNFYVEEGTVIGLPGSVHSNCGCYAGEPHQGASLVNDVLGNVVRFTKSQPKFKLRKARTA